MIPHYFHSNTWLLQVVIEIITLGVVNFCLLEPFFIRFFCQWIENLQHKCVADNPGCLHVFDYSVISLLRTLPEPNNCNHIHTAIPLHHPTNPKDVVVVRGYLPSCRMNSLTVHGNMTEVPHSIELTSKRTSDGKETREYEVVLVHEDSQYQLTPDEIASGTLLLSCKSHWKQGMIVMRNYLIAPGSTIYTPEVSWKHSGTLIRATERLVSGAAAIDRTAWIYRYGKKLPYFVFYHILLWIWNSWNLMSNPAIATADAVVVTIADHFFVNVGITFLGIIIASGIRSFIFVLGKYRMNQIMLPEPNIVRIVDLHKASQRSQPSQKHQYYIIRCLIPSHEYELKITAKFKESNQLYWSLIFYDEYGIPLPQCIFDRTVNVKNQKGEEYEIDVRLKNFSPTQPRWPSYEEGVTYLDIGPKQRKGFLLIRLLHPVNEEVKEYSKPTAELIYTGKDKSKLENSQLKNKKE